MGAALKLVRVASGWYETRCGRYSVLVANGAWKAVENGTLASEAFRTKREAVESIARRLTEERTTA